MLRLVYLVKFTKIRHENLFNGSIWGMGAFMLKEALNYLCNIKNPGFFSVSILPLSPLIHIHNRKSHMAIRLPGVALCYKIYGGCNYQRKS